MSKLTHSNKPEKDMKHFLLNILKIVTFCQITINTPKRLSNAGCVQPRCPGVCMSNELQI